MYVNFGRSDSEQLKDEETRVQIKGLGFFKSLLSIFAIEF